ncbi:MHC class II beta chain [Microbacterium sp. HM58-2]|nr:MHC class II beta chain [Microbacterium sp. HM58-2]
MSAGDDKREVQRSETDMGAHDVDLTPRREKRARFAHDNLALARHARLMRPSVKAAHVVSAMI